MSTYSQTSMSIIAIQLIRLNDWLILLLYLAREVSRTEAREGIGPVHLFHLLLPVLPSFLACSSPAG
jgi:hypothetical protein